jgi:hypothetical protein
MIIVSGVVGELMGRLGVGVPAGGNLVLSKVRNKTSNLPLNLTKSCDSLLGMGTATVHIAAHSAIRDVERCILVCSRG